VLLNQRNNMCSQGISFKSEKDKISAWNQDWSGDGCFIVRFYLLGWGLFSPVLASWTKVVIGTRFEEILDKLEAYW